MQKIDEQVLRSSEEQYRAIFNAAADALVLRDDNARVVDVNTAMTVLSGYSRDEVMGEQRWIDGKAKRHGQKAQRVVRDREIGRQPEPEQLAAMAVALGERNVLDGIGLRSRHPVAVSSGLIHRLTA